MNVKSVCGSCGEVAVSSAKGMMPMPDATSLAVANLPDGAGFIKKRQLARKRRMVTLGAVDAVIPEGKSAEDVNVDEFFVCSNERKALPMGQEVCDSCSGGCVAEKGLPTIIEVEGLAEELFEAKVLDSAFSAKNDAIVVQMEVADGRFVEGFWSSKTAEFMGWIFVKSDNVETGLTEIELSDIATKTIEGEVTDIFSDVFEDETAWSVSVSGSDGSDYDVFVSLDGKVLGYDIYEAEMKAAKKPKEFIDPAVDPMMATEGDNTVDSTEEVIEPVDNPEEDLQEGMDKKKPYKKSDESEIDEKSDESEIEEKSDEPETEEKSDDIIDATFLKALSEFEVLTQG